MSLPRVIDLDHLPEDTEVQEEHEHDWQDAYSRLAQNLGSDFLEHDHSMDS